jgi:hypothetical protein
MIGPNRVRCHACHRRHLDLTALPGQLLGYLRSGLVYPCAELCALLGIDGKHVRAIIARLRAQGHPIVYRRPGYRLEVAS